MSLSQNKSVVIGGGIAGLLCARVLSDFSKEVLIIEKEELPDDLSPRKGIPQGFHTHTLLDSGRRILNDYFPGFTDELIKNGNCSGDQTRDLKWFHHGIWKYSEPIGETLNIQSRWHLEGLARKKVKALPNVKFIVDKVEDVSISENRVSAVVGKKNTYQADLVMDCSGPISLIKNILQKHGYMTPPELRIKIDLKYATYLYKRKPEEKLDWTAMAIYPEAPLGNKSGILFPIVDEKHGPCWQLTAVGRNGEFPGNTHEDFLEFLRNLDKPDLHDFITKQTLISDKGHHVGFKENIRTYFDHLLRYPSGLLPCGDSFGRINPIFGQGMSIAAIESEILKNTFLEVNDTKTLTSLYLKRIGCFFDIPWFLVNCEDWRYPNVPGRRKAVKFINWYTGKLHKLCSNDKQIVSDMYSVIHFNKKPITLFKPKTVLKALFKKA